MDLVILEKIEPSILNGLGYIGRLEKKSGSDRNKHVTVTKVLKTVSFCGLWKKLLSDTVLILKS